MKNYTHIYLLTHATSLKFGFRLSRSLRTKWVRLLFFSSHSAKSDLFTDGVDELIRKRVKMWLTVRGLTN